MVLVAIDSEVQRSFVVFFFISLMGLLHFKQDSMTDVSSLILIYSNCTSFIASCSDFSVNLGGGGVATGVANQWPSGSASDLLCIINKQSLAWTAGGLFEADLYCF